MIQTIMVWLKDDGRKLGEGGVERASPCFADPKWSSPEHRHHPSFHPDTRKPNQNPCRKHSGHPDTVSAARTHLTNTQWPHAQCRCRPAAWPPACPLPQSPVAASRAQHACSKCRQELCLSANLLELSAEGTKHTIVLLVTLVQLPGVQPKTVA